jgi:hypothetical protein
MTPEEIREMKKLYEQLERTVDVVIAADKHMFEGMPERDARLSMTAMVLHRLLAHHETKNFGAVVATMIRAFMGTKAMSIEFGEALLNVLRAAPDDQTMDYAANMIDSLKDETDEQVAEEVRKMLQGLIEGKNQRKH